MAIKMSDDHRDIVNWADTSRIVVELIERHDDLKGRRGGQIVLVGGSAMLAHSIRISSGDIDIYSPDLDPDIVMDIEDEYKKKLGDDFRIDATPVENLWGNLMIRDIVAKSPLVQRVERSTSFWDIKALDVETLFLVKLEAGRLKDMNDLVGISQKTDALKLSARFNEMVKWHGIPDSVIGYADRFVESAKKLYGTDPVEVIKMIESSLPKRVTSMLMESWGDQEITVQDKDMGQYTGALRHARETMLATNQAITKLQGHIECLRMDRRFPVDVSKSPADRDARTQQVLEVLADRVQKMGAQLEKACVVIADLPEAERLPTLLSLRKRMSDVHGNLGALPSPQGSGTIADNAVQYIKSIAAATNATYDALPKASSPRVATSVIVKKPGP